MSRGTLCQVKPHPTSFTFLYLYMFMWGPWVLILAMPCWRRLTSPKQLSIADFHIRPCVYTMACAVAGILAAMFLTIKSRRLRSDSLPDNRYKTGRNKQRTWHWLFSQQAQRKRSRPEALHKFEQRLPQLLLGRHSTATKRATSEHFLFFTFAQTTGNKWITRSQSLA